MTDILMPRLSDTMTEGVIAAWHKQPGDAVAPGDVLVEIETDKALMEQQAYEGGILTEILVPEGGTAAIGTPIARLDDGSPAAGGTRPQAAAPMTPPTPTPLPETAVGGTPAAPGGPGDRRAASPLVRRTARERGIDLTAVVGTGPGGRIVRADLDALPVPEAPTAPGSPFAVGQAATAATAATAVAPVEREPRAVPFDPVRRAVAARLTESATTVPAFTATASADVTELLALRERINLAHTGTGTKVSLNDLLVRAAALALRTHPGVNASYSPEGDGRTLLHGRVHVGIAVAAPAGLVVPVVRDADRAPVGAISATTRALVARAADRTLSAAEMGGGTFTISNLGMHGVEHFTAIVNPPQGAILAVGAARAEPALIEGELVIRQRLRYTLSADHRIIDGALAAEFLATLTGLLENPLRIVA